MKNKKTQTIDIFSKTVESMTGQKVDKEYLFHPVRKWRFDYCIIDKKIALEVEGGVFSNGRHTRGLGFKNDMEKYNNAVLLGWRLIRVTPDDLMKLSTIQMIQQLCYILHGGAFGVESGFCVLGLQDVSNYEC